MYIITSKIFVICGIFNGSKDPDGRGSVPPREMKFITFRFDLDFSYPVLFPHEFALIYKHHAQLVTLC